jgi:hypothetical protein
MNHESNIVPLYRACAVLRITPTALNAIYETIGHSIDPKDPEEPVNLDTIRGLQGYVVDHHRQNDLRIWADVVQMRLEERGIRLRKAEALQVARFYCHEEWDRNRYVSDPMDVVTAFLHRNGLRPSG